MSTGTIIATVLGALGAFFGGCAALIKWALGRWDAAQAETRATQHRTTDALIANTASNAVLAVKMDQVVTSTGELSRKIDGIADFVQENTPVNQPMPQRRTPAQGVPSGLYGIKRGG